MSDLTPDLVAAVASRLYNESPSGPGILGMDQTPSAPVEPAAESTFREQLQAPSFPVPTDGIPVSASPVLTSQRPVAPIAEAGGREGFRVPTQFGDVSSGFRRPLPPSRNQTGVRFVQSIRGADYRSATEAFPNEKPDSKASVNQGPARSQGSLPGASDSVTYRPR